MSGGGRNVSTSMLNEENLDDSMAEYLRSCSEDMRSAIEGLYANFDGFRPTVVGLKCFEKYLIALLHKCDCRDVLVLSRIMRFCDLLCWPNFTSERWMTDAKRLSSQGAIVGERLTPDDFNAISDYAQMTYDVVQRGHYELLQVLLKYGLCTQPAREQKIMADGDISLLVWWFFRYILDRNGNDDSKLNVSHFMEELEAEVKKKLKPRTFIVIWVVDIVMSHFLALGMNKLSRRVATMYDDPEEFILMRKKCLELFVESTSEPYVAERDIRQFFHFFFNNPADSKDLKDLCTTFRTLFPKSKEHFQPRSLLDLSRCKIRDCMRNSSTLPEEVSKLPIPVIFKDFLLFKN